MNDELSNEPADTDEERSLLCRRLFLQSMGKWSGAAIAAAVFGSAWLAAPPEANAGAWVNRRGGGGGGWINGGGGGGGDGSTAVAMAAEGHGSIVGRLFTGIQLRGAENQLVTTNSRSFLAGLFDVWIERAWSVGLRALDGAREYRADSLLI
jgi:hypothetical protein